jgi:[protein-PII] uridylyltransferase
MNIVRAQAFSNRHGTIFDLIAFEDSRGYFDKNPSEVAQFEKMLAGVIDGNVQLDTLLQRKFDSVVYQTKKGRVSTTIHFDDDFSKRCTILEILTQDGFGLLYKIAAVISSHGCNIEVALIATEGHRAIDVFYLTQDGKKLSAELAEQVQRDLTARLSS